MKRARTVEEMRFVATLEPCSRCGSRQMTTTSIEGQALTWTVRTRCASCGAERSLELASRGNPTTKRIGRFDLGPLGSELVAPAQFLSAYEESIARVPEDPKSLPPGLRDRADDELTRALTCVAELLKLVPLDATQIPGTSDPRLQRSWLSSEFRRLRVLAGRYARPHSITDAALAAHRAWVANGAKGPGQLTLENTSLVRELYGSVDLTFAEIVRCDLTAIDLAEARLERALLEDDVLTFANVRAASFVSASIRGGTWRSVNATWAKLNDAEITGTDFSRSELEGSSWYDARVRGARFDGTRFGSAVFDRATFEQCSFVDASFAKYGREPQPTSDGARFVDCDLTSSDWTDRNLSGTTFVRCKLGGTTGRPSAVDGLVVDDCDLDRASFVAQLQRAVN